LCQVLVNAEIRTQMCFRFIVAFVLFLRWVFVNAEP